MISRIVRSFFAGCINISQVNPWIISVITLLISSKPEENPPTPNTGSFYIIQSIFQASRWEYAYLPYHSGLPSAIDYGGYYIDKNGKMCPIMMTLEPKPYVVKE